jgi:hypothetical protein
MSDLTQQPNTELSPWPMSVTVSTEPEVIVTVTGISGNSYVVLRDGAAIGFVSPTTASEDNVEDELPVLWTTPFIPPIPPPSPVTPLQLRRALNAAGLRDMVEAALVSAPQDAKDAWEFASEVKRDDATLCAMASALGLTSEQVDDIFALASSYS